MPALLSGPGMFSSAGSAAFDAAMLDDFDDAKAVQRTAQKQNSKLSSDCARKRSKHQRFRSESRRPSDGGIDFYKRE